MYQVIKDFNWMSFNVFLAIIPVLSGWFMIKVKNMLQKIALGIIWIVFLPNSIYLLTDVVHLFDDWDQSIVLLYKLIISFMYILIMVIGIFAFVLSLHPLEYALKKKQKTISIFIANFIIGFGMVLGRIERTNSWEVFTNFRKVVHDSIRVLISPEKIMLFIVFGILCNIIYFSCRKLVIKEVNELENL